MTPAGNERLLKWVAPLPVGILVLLLWHVLVKAFDVPRYLVPSPGLGLETLIADREQLFGSLLVTLKITFGAFVLAVIIGSVVAFLFVQTRWVEMSLFPYAVLLQGDGGRWAQAGLLVGWFRSWAWRRDPSARHPSRVD